MKYEYKMVKRHNNILWEEIGISNNRNPVDVDFANELGEDGFEMFQVVQYGIESCYYFRKRIT